MVEVPECFAPRGGMRSSAVCDVSDWRTNAPVANELRPGKPGVFGRKSVGYEKIP